MARVSVRNNVVLEALVLGLARQLVADRKLFGGMSSNFQLDKCENKLT